MKEWKEWIVFYNRLTGKELLRYSIEGTFKGEMEATIRLLAYENNVVEDDIEIKIE